MCSPLFAIDMLLLWLTEPGSCLPCIMSKQAVSLTRGPPVLGFTVFLCQVSGAREQPAIASSTAYFSSMGGLGLSCLVTFQKEDIGRAFGGVLRSVWWGTAPVLVLGARIFSLSLLYGTQPLAQRRGDAP